MKVEDRVNGQRNRYKAEGKTFYFIDLIMAEEDFNTLVAIQKIIDNGD